MLHDEPIYLKDKIIGDDELKNYEKKIQNQTDAQISDLEKKLAEKEKEVMTIWIKSTMSQ